MQIEEIKAKTVELLKENNYKKETLVIPIGTRKIEMLRNDITVDNIVVSEDLNSITVDNILIFKDGEFAEIVDLKS